MTPSPPPTGCSIRWWGHAAATVELDGARLVTDPLLRARIGPLHWAGWRPDREHLEAVDAVLVSHLHRDHADLPSLARFPARTRVVVPAGGGDLVRPAVRGRVEELDVGDTTEVAGVTVHAVFAEHDGHRRFGGPRAAALGYLLTGSRSVYFAGDTDLFPAMRSVLPESEGTGRNGLDAALVPVGGWGLNLGPGHLDPERAARALTLLRPALAVPVHWGTLRIPVLWRSRPSRSVTPPQQFARHAARLAPGTQVVALRPGESCAVSGRVTP